MSTFHLHDDDEKAELTIHRFVDIQALKRTLQTKELFGKSLVVHALARLAYELRGDIPTATGVLIDDASGRIPGLLVWRLVNCVREKNGLPPITAYMVAPTFAFHVHFSATEREIRNRVRELAPRLGKTIFVTEFVGSGQGLRNILSALETAGNAFVVAAVSIAFHPFIMDSIFAQKPYPRVLLEHLRFGTTDDAGLEFHFLRPRITGVKKTLRYVLPYAVREEKPDRRLMAAVRRDLHVLAEAFLPLVVPDASL